MRYSIYFVFIFLTKVSNGQIRLKNADVLNGDSAIVFRDVINHFKVEGIEDFSRHQVVIKGGMLSLARANEFIVREIKSDTVLFQVFALGGKTKKEVYKGIFQVQRAGSLQSNCRKNMTRRFQTDRQLIRPG